MLVTEEEAKEKWCPMARTAGYNCSRNREYTGSTPSVMCCIGSNCMMWEWDLDSDNRGYCSLSQRFIGR